MAAGVDKRKGYGTFYMNGTVRAHRAAWQLLVGEIPPGQWVLHRCDVRYCVNPAHLYLGSITENARDATVRGRWATGNRASARLYPDTVARGERGSRAKLKESQVLEIRRLGATGKGYRILSRLFGIGQTTVRHILKRNTWVHI